MEKNKSQTSRTAVGKELEQASILCIKGELVK